MPRHHVDPAPDTPSVRPDSWSPTGTRRLTVGRTINGFCYLITGVAIITGLVVGYAGPWYLWLAALAIVAYGVKILMTRTSYWIHSAVYLLPVFGVIYLFLRVTGKL